nr:hypothetical conserved protein [uncultured Gammaproteobacteria bacterium]
MGCALAAAGAEECLTPGQLAKQPQDKTQPVCTYLWGHKMELPAIDRRHIRAWFVGANYNFPAPSERRVEPYASLYFWEHPNEGRLFWGDVALLYNNLFFAQRFRGNFEWITSFENFTVPFQQNELIDGKKKRAEEILWGYVRPGIGIGWRRMVAPFYQDNMQAVSLVVQPGYLYFGDSAAGQGFRDPSDTFETRVHLHLRWDAVTRNLISLPQEGFALGGDAIYGHRFHWRDWGLPQDIGKQGHRRAEADYAWFSAYALGVAPLSWLDETRHHVLGAVHAGIGPNMDRFSHTPTTRPMGGFNPLGQEYHSTRFPVLPGAALLEFFPDRYAIVHGEYRFQPTFFSAVSAYGGAGYLNPQRRLGDNIDRKDTVMPFVGGRLVTGFFGGTLLTLDYAHNFGLHRKETGHGNQVVVSLSGQF